MTLTVGSLFAGIGGFDLGLERAGMRVAWQCEIDPDARAILAKHWPEVPCYGDIRSIDWSDVEPVDVICGGYPCQPFSHAGSRQGSDDPRHLWPEVARCVGNLRPRYVLLENVAGHLSLGFGSVLGDLAALGYDAWWDCIPAAALGAPHLRDRVFVVAWRATADEDREPVRHEQQRQQRRATVDGQGVARDDGSARPDTDADGVRRIGQSTRDGANRGMDVQRGNHTDGCGVDRGRMDARKPWGTGPPVSPVRRMDDGIPARMDAPRLRGLGNAIVPQIPELLGRIIMEMEQC